MHLLFESVLEAGVVIVQVAERNFAIRRGVNRRLVFVWRSRGYCFDLQFLVFRLEVYERQLLVEVELVVEVVLHAVAGLLD